MSSSPRPFNFTAHDLEKRQAVENGNPYVTDGTTNMAWSEGYADMNAKRKGLPVMKHLDSFYQALDSSRVVIVDSPTGSGKSTQIPQACAAALHAAGVDGAVILTQPRCLYADLCATRLGVETDLGLGGAHSVVGVQRRGKCVMPTGQVKPRIIVMTDGTLISQMCHLPYLDGYSVIIVDEVHERSENMDLLMGLLRVVLCHRDDLKVVCMSATGDVTALKRHFYTEQLGEPAVVNLEGAPQEIIELFLREPAFDWARCATDIIYTILANPTGALPDGDIIVFAPGVPEIRQAQDAVELIKLEHPDLCQNVDFLGLYRDLPADEQSLVLNRNYTYSRIDGQLMRTVRRKVIFATNIAETSLTLPDLDFVLDSGFNKTTEYDPFTGAWLLMTMNVAQAQAMQRRGRVGRRFVGYWFPMYTRDTFNQFAPYQERTAIQRTDITGILLKVIMFALLLSYEVNEFPWPSQPFPEQLVDAGRNLRALGFLSADGQITDDGVAAAELSLEPHLARLYLNTVGSNLRYHILAIIAIMEVGTVRRNPETKDEEDRAHDCALNYRSQFGDVLTDMNVFVCWLQYRNGGHGRDFAYANLLDYSACKDAARRLDELLAGDTNTEGVSYVDDIGAGLDPKFQGVLAYEILRALPHHLVVKVERKRGLDRYFVWQNLLLADSKGRGDRDYHLQRTSVLQPHADDKASRLPAYAVYHRLKGVPGKRKLNMVGVTVVTEHILRKYFPDFDNAHIPRVGTVPGAELAGADAVAAFEAEAEAAEADLAGDLCDVDPHLYD